MKTLRAYIITRILFTIPMLFILITLVFFVVRIMPGDPVEAMLRPGVPQEYKDQIRHNLGLDRPLFFNWRGSRARSKTGPVFLSADPSADAARIMMIDQEMRLDVSGRQRNTGGDWLRVAVPEQFEGWVSPEQMRWMRQVNTEMVVLEEKLLPGGETWTSMPEAGPNVQAIWGLASGVLWFGGDDGVRRYSSTGWDVFTATTGSRIQAIWGDKPSEIWFGTDGDGLLRLRGSEWSRLTIGDGLPGDHIWAIWGQGSRTLWVGTDQGAALYNGRRWQTFTTADGLAGGAVRAIWGDGQGTVWLGAEGGLSRYDGQTWTTWTVADGLPANAVYALTGDAQGRVWVGTAGGPALWNGQNWTAWSEGDGPAGRAIQAIWVDADGLVWVGSEGGLSRYDGRSWSGNLGGPADGQVRTIYRDAAGALWIGTSAGLLKLDNRPWTRLRVPEGGMEGWAPADRFAITVNPFDSQYFNYLWALLRLDLGVSLAPTRGRPVIQDLQLKFPATLELAISSLLLTILIGVSTGAYAAHKRRSVADYGFRIFSIVIWAVPVFWLGILFQLVFGVYLSEWYETSAFALKWVRPVFGDLLPLPISGRIGIEMAPRTITGLYVLDSLLTGNWAALKHSLRYLLLPSLTLGLYLSGVFTRLTRSNMLDVLKADFITAARARGIKENVVVYQHALKNAFIPILTMMGLQFAALLAGAVLTETTFSWPGMGLFMWERISYRDFNSIQGSVVFFAVLVSLVSLIVDIIYAWIDPRIRY